ncbi:multiheme c-type cytochrome [Thalassoglobus sp. JC818]|uniref:multiheme c-type cytochrome n=1 Tax=Thalassoglobus sp. JC818 TaxID=3232136 RepID=UPI003459B1D9
MRILDESLHHPFRSLTIVLIYVMLFSVVCDAQTLPTENSEESMLAEWVRTIGVSRGDCKKCHPSEVAAWMKSTHFRSADLRLFAKDANTQKYVAALNIDHQELATTSVCASCHGTQAIRRDQVVVLGGISCEKCHGPAGGENGWLNRHQSYDADRVIPRTLETAEHRAERLKECNKAGMIRSDNLYDLAKACYRCHLVNNEDLVAAGHRLASAFDFVSWSDGEVRHNFFMNRDVNADAPSLWLETTGNSVQNRRRLKFVVGALVQLEMGLRARAATTNPVLVPQIGGMIAAANGKVSQISGVAPTADLAEVTSAVNSLMATLFVPLPDDAQKYSLVADDISKVTKQFLKDHDGSELSGVDALLVLLQPHYSQHFIDRYRSAGDGVK